MPGCIAAVFAHQPTHQPVADNGKVFTAATLLTLFTVLEAKSSAAYCAPHEHVLAALFIWYALHASCSPPYPRSAFLDSSADSASMFWPSAKGS